MNKIKAYLIYIPIITWFIWSFCFWLKSQWGYGTLEESFPYSGGNIINTNCDDNTDLWNCTSIKEKNDTIIVRLLKLFGLDDSTKREKDRKFIDYAKAILNMALWLIAFIALIMSIYTFYLMIFSENEAWIKKAKWNLVGIFIALCVIWLARSIVSLIFWRYQKNRKAKQEIIPSNNIISMDTTLNNNYNLSNYLI